VNTLSLGQYCPEVKLPKVVQTHRSKLTKVVFIQLLKSADDQGFFELKATELAQNLGISRRKIYYVIRFLQKVNLLFCKIERKGRGHHSLYKLNWKKCAQTVDKNNTKNHIYDRPSAIQKNKKNSSPWTRKMKAFRNLLEQSWMVPNEIEICLKLIGRRLKNKSRHEALELYHRLARTIPTLEIPNWVLEIKHIYMWFGSVLKRLGNRVSAH